MARLRVSWRTSLTAPQQARNPQSESIARNPYDRPQGFLVTRFSVRQGLSQRPPQWPEFPPPCGLILLRPLHPLHRRIKRLVRPGLGFGSLQTARRTLAGYEGMGMIRKGQVRTINGGGMQAQATFVATLFGIAA